MTDVIALLRRHEGEVLHAYEDSEGYLTIGVGVLIDERRGGGITPEESAMLLQNRLDRYIEGLDRRIPWWRELSEIRQAALLNMAYNLGVSGLLGFHNMLEALQDHDWHRAANEALSSRWARQVGYRSKEIARMIEREELPDGVT